MMPTKTLSINELVMLLALDDDEGKVGWSVTPCFDYALAGGMLAELAIEGFIDVTADGDLELKKENEEHSSPLLNEVLHWFQDCDHPHTVAGWVSAVSTLEGLDHRQMEELVNKGILVKKEGHFLLIFPTTTYPMLDRTAEKEVLERIREAVLGTDSVPRRLGVLITIAHGAHLLRGPLSDEELAEAEKRLMEIATGLVIAEATLDLIHQAERALYVASSIPFMGIGRL